MTISGFRSTSSMAKKNAFPPAAALRPVRLSGERKGIILARIWANRSPWRAPIMARPAYDPIIAAIDQRLNQAIFGKNLAKSRSPRAKGTSSMSPDGDTVRKLSSRGFQRLGTKTFQYSRATK